jgi:hypothetical protein
MALAGAAAVLALLVVLLPDWGAGGLEQPDTTPVGIRATPTPSGSREAASPRPTPTPHPVNRVRAAWVASENRLFVVGGAVPASLAMLDFTRRGWTDLPDLPAPLRDASAAILPDGGLMVVGGRRNGEPVQEVIALDAEWRAWSHRAPMPLPQSNMAVAVHDGLVYCFGGHDTGLQNVLIYDPAADAWAFGAPIPAPVSHGAAAAVGDAIYLFGGQADGQQVGHLAYRYDPAADRWDPLPDMPLAGEEMSATVVADRIWVVVRDWVWLASTSDPAPDERFGRVLVFDPVLAEWTVSRQRVNPGAGSHMAVPLANGDLLVIVGSPVSSTSNTIHTQEP